MVVEQQEKGIEMFFVECNKGIRVPEADSEYQALLSWKRCQDGLVVCYVRGCHVGTQMRTIFYNFNFIRNVQSQINLRSKQASQNPNRKRLNMPSTVKSTLISKSKFTPYKPQSMTHQPEAEICWKYEFWVGWLITFLIVIFFNIVIGFKLIYNKGITVSQNLGTMASTTFIHKKLSYFFTRSERIDLQIGLGLNLSMNYCIDVLEQVTFATSSNTKSKNKIMQASLALLSQVVKICHSVQPYQLTNQRAGSAWQYGVDPKKYEQFYQNDGLRCCVFALKNYIDYLVKSAGTAKVSIVDEMIVKTLMNLVYVVIYSYKYIFELIDKTNIRSFSNTRMKSAIEELQLDSLLIKLVTLTLDTFYLPIKKLVLLYTRVLAILFSQTGQKQDLYEDNEMLDLSLNNLLTENYLQVFKQKNKPEEIKKKSKQSDVEAFYAKNNVGECPLAQSIVVGLLRSLLTICNSQSHKKFQLNVPKGSGADSYRQWQISYQFIIQTSSSKDSPDYKQYLSTSSTKYLKDYTQYNDLPPENPAEKQISSPLFALPTHYQFYRHKIYTTLAISTFFSFLLISFKKNATIQFTYLYELMSEANGVLVFLKFLTDKFQCLQPVQDIQLAVSSDKKTSKTQPCKCSSLPFLLTFKDEVMLAVYSVLLVLYGACNNYTEKTRSYLFEYNSYLIIKKIPHIFMKVHKNDDQLPSEEEIQAEFGRNLAPKKSSQVSNQDNIITNKVKQLTQLCYSLLKIQIPFFSKKMKENANNMKMIIQIYCQMPKKMDPIQRTELDKLLLKNQMRKIQNQKYILSVEELKAVHNEYNNLYYWSNQQAKINQIPEQSQENIVPLTMSREEMDKWLQENVWKFYD